MIDNVFDFNNGLKEEKRDIVSSLLDNHFLNFAKIYDLKDRKFPNVDYAVKARGKVFPIEAKVDKYYKTGNIVIELVAYCDILPFASVFQDNLASKQFFINSSIHGELVSLIDKKEWKGRNGLGFSDELEQYHLLLYVYYNDKEDVIKKYFIFNAKEINEYIKTHYKKHNLLITRSINRKSGKKWLTISSLVPLSNLLDEVKHCTKEGS